MELVRLLAYRGGWGAGVALEVALTGQCSVALDGAGSDIAWPATANQQ